MQDSLRSGRTQSAALGALARHESFVRQDFASSLAAITRTAVTALGASRASIWLLRDNGESLECANLCVAAEGHHASDIRLVIQKHPNYFRTIETERVIVTSDAPADPRLQELRADYLAPHSVTSLLHAQVMVNGTLAGAIWCEQVEEARTWNEDDILFATSLASFVALALAAEQRRRTEERLKLAVAVTRSAVWDAVPERGEIWWSPEYYAMLGLEPGVLPTHKAWEDMIHPEDRASVLDALAKVYAGGLTELRLVYRMRRRDGQWIWVEDVGRAIRDPQVGCLRWTGIKSDVTDRVTTDRALRAAEERFRSLFENAVEGIWQVTPSGNILAANPALAALLDYPTPEALMTQSGGAPLLFANPARWPELLALLETHDRVSRHEAELLSRTGKSVWTRLNLRLVRDESGQPVMVEGSITDVTTVKRAEAQLAHAALHDGLTSLPNRYLFLDRVGQSLARARRRGTGTAVLLLDFDSLKLINDSLGHRTGDRIIVETANRLRSALRPSDSLARLGSDEFAILIEGLSATNEAIAFAEALQAAVGLPLTVEGQEVFPSVTVGIAFEAGDDATAESIVRDAGIALDRAKSMGRGQCLAFTASMRSEPLVTLRLQSEMRRGIERNEFLLHYQPVIDLRTRTLVGFEALIRWRHPQRGLVAPAVFLPVAEESGLMAELDAWVMEEACRQVAKWQKHLPDDQPFSISVNMAPSQLAAPNLFRTVDKVIAETGADIRRLRLEVTEATLAADAELVSNRLRGLRDRGFRIMIDDFGTGYSSLSRLHRFPIDGLKIDQSFVRPMLADRDSGAIVRTVIALSKTLGLNVVAEGVEDEATAGELARLDCDLAQGYLFARPLDVAVAETLVMKLASSAPAAIEA